MDIIVKVGQIDWMHSYFLDKAHLRLRKGALSKYKFVIMTLSSNSQNCPSIIGLNVTYICVMYLSTLDQQIKNQSIGKTHEYFHFISSCDFSPASRDIVMKVKDQHMSSKSKNLIFFTNPREGRILQIMKNNPIVFCISMHL